MSYTINRRSTRTQTQSATNKRSRNQEEQHREQQQSTDTLTSVNRNRMAGIGPTRKTDFQPSDEAKKCPVCSKSFGLTLWKHHCHWCGEVVCDDCSKTTMAFPPMYTDPVRVCDLCKVPAANHGSKNAPRRLGTASQTLSAPASSPALTTSATANSGASPMQANPSNPNYDEERAKRAAAVAARMQANKPASKSGAAGSSSNDASAATEEAERQKQREIKQRIYERDMAAQRNEKVAKEKKQHTASSLPTESPPLSREGTSSSASFIAPAETSTSPVNASVETTGSAATSVVSPSPAPTTAATRSQGSNPMLEAALRRQEAAKAKTGGAAQSASTSVDPERLQLLNRISQILTKQRKDEPFGLRSMDATKLRTYLRHLEGGV